MLITDSIKSKAILPMQQMKLICELEKMIVASEELGKNGEATAYKKCIQLLKQFREKGE